MGSNSDDDDDNNNNNNNNRSLEAFLLLERPGIQAKPLAVPFPLLGSGQREREGLDFDVKLLPLFLDFLP